jgi:hypothetical protein
MINQISTRVKAQHKHAARRAKERYDLKLTKSDIIQIISIIQDRKATASKKLTNKRTMHIVKYKDKELKAIYDKRRHSICTFMPANWKKY